MADHSMMRLGKGPARVDHRTLRMAKYMPGALPAFPTTADWFSKVTSWGMMLNDQLGDCTCATAGHMEQAWTSQLGTTLTLPDQAILDAYKAVSGYNGDPLTDQGANELNVLNYWRQTGVGGRKIDAYVALDVANQDHLKAGIFLFGGAYVGVRLPLSAQKQDTWHLALGGTDGDPSPNSWGGHAIPLLGYDAAGLICVTWGGIKRLTWDWWAVYGDEAYAVLSPDWVAGASSLAPSGFDMAALRTDLALVV